MELYCHLRFLPPISPRISPSLSPPFAQLRIVQQKTPLTLSLPPFSTDLRSVLSLPPSSPNLVSVSFSPSLLRSVSRRSTNRIILQDGGPFVLCGVHAQLKAFGTTPMGKFVGLGMGVVVLFAVVVARYFPKRSEAVLDPQHAALLKTYTEPMQKLFKEFAANYEAMLKDNEVKIVAEIKAIKAEIKAKIDAKIDAMIDAKIDAMIDANIDAKTDAMIDAMIDSKIDAKIEANDEAMLKLFKESTANNESTLKLFKDFAANNEANIEVKPKLDKAWENALAIRRTNPEYIKLLLKTEDVQVKGKDN